MATTETILPEDVLIATLHRIGSGIRLTDDQRLSDIFHEAALNGKDCVFAPFKSHPLYGYSRVLGEALQTLDHGGSIVRENAAQLYFQATDHTAGPFGKAVYEQLTADQRALVDTVAEKIRQAFGVVDEPASAGTRGT